MYESIRGEVVHLHRFFGAEHGNDYVGLRAHKLPILAKIFIIPAQFILIESEVIAREIEDLVWLCLVVVLQKLVKKVWVALESRLRAVRLKVVIVLKIQRRSITTDSNSGCIAHHRDPDRPLSLRLHRLILPAFHSRESHHIVNMVFLFVIQSIFRNYLIDE